LFIRSISSLEDSSFDGAAFFNGSVFNLLPIGVIHAIKDKKYSIVKDFISNSKNINCVDVDNNNILMIAVHSHFSDPDYINEKNAKFIADFFNSILENKEFNIHSKNDFNQSLKNIVSSYLPKCKKNKCAIDLLRAILYHINHSKVKEIMVIRQDSPIIYRPNKKEEITNSCIIL
jgi:hypothetical protein